MVTGDGQRAIAADPDRDTVSVVDLPGRQLLWTIDLEPGDEPGRVVEGSDRRAHVALRRAGDVVTLDTVTGRLLRRDPACGGPRGMAYVAATDALHVACAEGRLVTLAAGTGARLRSVDLPVDLRDVIAGEGGVLVSRFKSSELIRVSGSGEITGRIALSGVQRTSERLVRTGLGAEGNPIVPVDVDISVVDELVEPAVAWRALDGLDGSVKILHQYALASPIELDEADPADATAEATPYGTPSRVPTCGGIVQPAISTVGSDDIARMGRPLIAPALAVDAALSPDGQWIAVAHAGVRDPSALGALVAGLGQISIVSANDAERADLGSCASPTFQFPVDGQTTAVAFNPRVDAQAQTEGTWIVAQTREPPALFLMKDPVGTTNGMVPLEGSSMLDTGHELFHRDTGAGIACASCHVEGGEDGRIWQFDPIGARRTQALFVGLEGMDPFHWDGDIADFDALMEEVFVGRMGGPHQSPDRTDALERWLFTLAPPTPIRSSDAPDVARGRALFESEAVGCSFCHSGPALSNNDSVDVGTAEPGHRLQVPSLVGVGYRAPFLHDGCARTLEERFDPACGGGDAHGKTSGLSSDQIRDLVGYLESL